MNEQKREELKGYLSNYLSLKGININKPFVCLNPSHTDHSPSMRYDQTRKKVHCFSCGVDWDIFDLIGAEIGSNDFTDQYKELCRVFNLQDDTIHPEGAQSAQKAPTASQKPVEDIETTPKLTEYMEACYARVSETSYWESRGLGQETIDRFKLGYDPHYTRQGANWNAVIIPTSEYSYSARNTDPEADKKSRYRKEGTAHVFNLQAIYGSRPVFITEGEIDALSIIESGYEAIALGSLQNNTLQQTVEGFKPCYPLILALDNDERGQDAMKPLQESLEGLNTPYITCNLEALGVKDPNEALTTLGKDKLADFLKGYEQEAIDYEEAQKKERVEEYIRTTSASAYVDSFLDYVADRSGSEIPTGFKRLDDALDGGLFSGLYIIGAVSTLGKTTLMLQLADNLAEQGQDVLLFSYEMNKAELMAKSISRITAIYSMGDGVGTRYARTTREIINPTAHEYFTDEDKEYLNASVEKYRDIGKHLFIYEALAGQNRDEINADFIGKAVAKHIELTGNRPVVIIDYLQIMPPRDPKATDKQNMDYAVMALKAICNNYRVPVLTVSSFSRSNYDKGVNMGAFKESGAIEYTADILIGLQYKGTGGKDFDLEEAQNQTPRNIELKILKNRNGRTGITIDYSFYQRFNCYKEALFSVE